ncbi:glycoside hydrolase family 3 C-terminal domain-containing protein [Microbacterium hominis]|uniref:glycoside hydrolase family 3 protein n=1 Tax=Microbacterium TaxID=33882 RepID=UPI00168B925C|nr:MULTISPECIES: glycoside hydrolase family 3 N-terminal domain-containing protein [Microbacterium]QOC26643.1 glycoside hydrolase family 3 C-terminal domain-containing protein [Microbacterium hominis]QOC27816.1 glycoside hydrolase family 3 C-terminal domain-containing protein [Microbacterium hominis]QYF97030.1 glycoside hydrolase family 3 C-terminal domain-containing protein [Microbacterium sp. PAMC21962]
MTTDTTTTPPTAIERPWLDADLPIDERVELLLGEMTVEEKAGLFFQTMIAMGPDGALSDGDPAFGLPSTDEYVRERHMTHFNLLGVAPTAREIAQWHNRLQELAASTRLGIPVTISTDPRHSFTENPGTAMLSGPFSQWPDALGLAATRDEELVRTFGDIARQEYTAVGIRVALHPQVDLATEPRWARQLQTFGEDAELSARLGAAYIRGFQGDSVGAGSVSTMVKHFPGGGPQKDGEDPHFAYGREQVYPGDAFELHLKPFEAAFAAGVRQVMPYYGMPVGTQYEEVGFGFNKSVLTGLLRERFGFDGIVCTDWGLLTDSEIMGTPFPARAWGVEHLTPAERMAKTLDAGADQFGGERCTEILLQLVADGVVAEDRLDVSARRLLREKFLLGLFDDPYVDVDAADRIVGSPDFRAAGDAAQRAAITVLAATDAVPFGPEPKLYVEGIDADLAAQYGQVVATPGEADVAVLRLQAPYEQRGSMFENFFHAGSLDFPDEVVAHVAEVAAAVPTVVDVFLDRPAILTPLVELGVTVTGNWGASSAALLDVLSGRAVARGRLPFDLPRSMAAVEASRPDVPFDTIDPLFRFGHGVDL